MITISLCMIVKNEEKVIGRCLDCVKDIVDEIIIVDTGSTDKTKEISLRYTDLVYNFIWTEDFSSARNFSFSKAGKDYCMWLDADDILTKDNQRKLLELKNTISPDTDVIMCKYNTAFDDKGTPTFSYYRERIIKRSSNLVWSGKVHEVISPSGKIIYSDFAVNHNKIGIGDPDRNLKIFENMISKGMILNAREQFYYGRELYYHSRYRDAAEILNNFLGEGKGWVENNIDACKILSYCHYKNGNEKLALNTLFRSFEYDNPRAETCCDIGKHFFDRNMIKQAVFWYEEALLCKKDDKSGGFILEDCYNYVPYIQLCVCWYRLGRIDKAISYNNMAGKYKPQSIAYLENKKFFAVNCVCDNTISRVKP